jgi:uncharacterized RDD family membrane protein YckC
MEGMNNSGTLTCNVCKKEFSQAELISFKNDKVCSGCKDSYFQHIHEGVINKNGTNLIYSSVGRRFLAMILDGLILGLLGMIPYIALGASMFGKMNSAEMSSNFITSYLISTALSFVINIVYYVGFIGKKGATPGKMIMKIKIVTPSGQPVSYGTAFLRYIGLIISFMILGIGYLMAIFDRKEKRTLHDRIASTRVIRY